jgi:hypothetical protein
VTKLGFRKGALAWASGGDRNASGVPDAGAKICFHAEKSIFYVWKRTIDSKQSYIV